MIRLFFCGLAAAGAAVLLSSETRADWPAWMGSTKRSGHADGKPGPRSGKVLWTYKAAGEMFIGSPAASGDRLYLGTVGPLGTGVIRCLDAAGGKVIWQLPDAKVPGLDAGSLRIQPIVSAPAVVGGRVVIGGGMHQDNRTILRCLSAADGRPEWSLVVESHLEGGPTIEGGRVYTGGGGEGVICVEIEKVVISRAAAKAVKTLKVAPEYDALMDKELTAAEARAAWDKEWARQLKIAKEDDLPPDELPRPQPKVVWKSGGGKLHVDAAVAVSADRVFAGSAYIDAEKIGHRAVVALDAKTGRQIWEVPVAYNPWGPPSVSGNTILVGCSSIRFDAAEVPHAKGEVLALSALDGRVIWKRPMTGGVLSATALAADSGFVSCTDGRLHELDLFTGAVKNTYDCKAPVFATPAVVGGTAYVPDLKGVLHAVDTRTMKGLWTVNLAAAGAPGPVFASPIVHGGQLYVASNSGALVCIAEK
jgi:outer membrane protein assembly factor BamB